LGEGYALDRIPLNSTILAWAHYIPHLRLLQLGLRTGKDYEYYDVPAERYRDLLAAESKGRYYNQHIRNNFRFQRIITRGAG
jgi:hypothetical protein